MATLAAIKSVLCFLALSNSRQEQGSKEKRAKILLLLLLRPLSAKRHDVSLVGAQTIFKSN